jgi:hypothetical protein
MNQLDTLKDRTTFRVIDEPGLRCTECGEHTPGIQVGRFSSVYRFTLCGDCLWHLITRKPRAVR